ncbi:hypothetical protein [Glutamicibacter ardleyensis]|uniref:hypothetical protein n=1 Tax=Glutamicibacter ardleyensis TaxID=225894 RepID=UPI003FD1423F
MAADFISTSHHTEYDQQITFPEGVQKSAAASAASSPGRRAQTSPTWEAADSFTHENQDYTLLRLYPGEEAPEPITPHRTATAELPTQTGQVIRTVQATARTTELIHVAWTDDAGETLVAWCPARSVIY